MEFQKSFKLKLFSDIKAKKDSFVKKTNKFFHKEMPTHHFIERVEPPFWYAGMKNKELQIMFYGKNIAKSDVFASNPIIITVIERSTNPDFLFVTIDTNKLKAQVFEFTFTIAEEVMFVQKYELKERRKKSAYRKGFNSSDLIYLLMPDRFAKGKSNGEGDRRTIEKINRHLPEGRHGGNIAGIIDNLDYIQELGATTVWCTPVCEADENACSYHTYAQTDVYKIDPRFGTTEEYIKLSTELHKRGMKLIKDYIVNHWSINHWLVKNLPSEDWLNNLHGFTTTNYKLSTQFDLNASEIDKINCTSGWFAPSMPDLNQANPRMLRYLIQNAIWWIEYADLDGLRVDTYSYCDKEGITKWTKAILNEYPNFNIVGEIWILNQANVSFWQNNSAISAIQNFNSHLPSVMDFTLMDVLSKVFNEDDNTWYTGMIKLYDNFSNDFLFPDVNNLLIFAENHDTNRLNDVYYSDLAKYKLVMTVLATVRGIPQIYYGSEIGIIGNKERDGDAAIRKDFPGGWEEDHNKAFCKEGRTAEQQAMFEFTAKLFTWRKTAGVIHTGKTKHYIPENNVYVYFRYTDTEAVMVIINNNLYDQTIETKRFQEGIRYFGQGKDVLTDVVIDLKKEIFIPAKTSFILDLEYDGLDMRS